LNVFDDNTNLDVNYYVISLLQNNEFKLAYGVRKRALAPTPGPRSDVFFVFRKLLR
jgi:hypothetical protein